jgi:DNA gyrase/topoisomerase IV subunit A
MDELKSILVEIREMLKVLSDRQEYIMKNIDELKEQNKKLSEEVKINSFVLNNITPRNEIIN